jgi:hypothetical protein
LPEYCDPTVNLQRITCVKGQQASVPHRHPGSVFEPPGALHTVAESAGI